MAMESVYCSLDEARAELAKRWANVDLRKAIEAEAGIWFLPDFAERPRAVLFRQLLSPDNGFLFFHQCARYINAEPINWEYLDDTWVSFNDEKKGYGRLRLTTDGGDKVILDIIDFHANERRKIRDVQTNTGQSVVEFHHELIKRAGYRIEMPDMSLWLRAMGRPADYYYYVFLHFVTHGVLFETMEADDAGGNQFVKTCGAPNYTRVFDKFGLKPLIIRSFPDDQSDDEDYYWWSYPRAVNDYLISYAADHGHPLTSVRKRSMSKALGYRV